nr:VCBS repeat-containing protein [Terriglobales bacterium]
MNASRISSTLLLIFFLIPASIFASAQRFVRAPIYSAGAESGSVAVGDFNGDGNSDLAFLSSESQTAVNIRLGTGDGTFSKGQQITLGHAGASIITGDWNNDGVLDLAAAEYECVAILLGNGDGTFLLQGNYNPDADPGHLATGDLNGDGIADIVTTDFLPYQNIRVLLGLGGGQFSDPMRVNTEFYSAIYGVAVADFNGDGKLDIAAVGDDNYDGVSQLIILQGNGDGTFRRPHLYETTLYADGNPIVGDFNQDGIPDLAVDAFEVSIYIGRGNGTFRRQVTYPGTPDERGAFLVAGDFNNDGIADLASSSFASNYLAVLYGNGDGTFKASSLFGTGPCPYSAVAADFNKDGNLDLAVPDDCDTNFVELVGDGKGNFLTRRSFPLGIYSEAGAVAAGYLDSDKHLDLIVADSGSPVLSILVGDKNGGFRVTNTYLSNGVPAWVATADLNDDGSTDVVVAEGRDDTVGVVLGNGDGTLQNEVTYPTGNNPVFAAAVDVNGDGEPDLLTANAMGNSISVLLASGSGYLPHKDYSVIRPLRLAFADFNRDGKVDVATANSIGPSQIFLGNGDGTFATGVKLTINDAPAAVGTGDLDHDGNPDVVLLSAKTGLIYTFLGNGDGTFGAGITSPAPVKPTQMILADFD